MHHVEVFLLIAGAVAVTAFCRRRGLPAPLVLVALGLVVSLVPGVPRYEVDPELILEFVLPPLLYSAALSSSYQDFRRSLNSITRLGVGLVLVSAFAVAWVAWAVVPGLPFTAALVLGAVVAPPDAVAATAVGRRLGLPRRVMTLLTGESLINDATSLTLYKVALAGVATGATDLSDGLAVFATAVGVGVGLGLALGWVLHRVRMHLDDSVVASAIGLLTPFAAYWSAEALRGSGVLAVVTAGLYLGHMSPRTGYATRLVQEPIWATLDLVLEAFTFALIGVQLTWLVSDVTASDQGLGHAVLVAGVVLAVVVVVRPLYVVATARMDHIRLRGSHRPARDRLSGRESAVISWAGMRGVVTLAAAAAIPVTSGGRPFPERASLQLAAYIVAISTLLLQGLSLPWVIRRLGVRSDADDARDRAQEAQTRTETDRAAREVVAARRDAWAAVIGDEAADRITTRLSDALIRQEQATSVILEASPADGELAEALPSRGKALQQLRRDVIAAQRAVLVARRDSGQLDEVVMRALLRELDLADESLASSPLGRL